MERLELLVGAVGDGAKLSEGCSGDHSAVDEAVASGIERIEELEFESCGLCCEEEQDLGVADKGVHRVVVGVGDECDVGERREERGELRRGVAPCDDERCVGIGEDVLGEVFYGLDVFGDGEVGVVEGVGGLEIEN